ncbi:MAG: MFS transporter, partial [Eubacteriales bacterium]
FYCWGHVFVVVMSTVFFAVFGIQNWRILAFIWALIPFFNAFYYMLVPIRTLSEENESVPVKKLLKNKLFWVFALLMVCAGASEQAMSQWASAFAEAGLSVSKTIGDLTGPCMFAILMGLARVFYARFSERIRLTRVLALCCVTCAAGYLLAVFAPNPILSLAGCGLVGLSVGMFWPGTFSLASSACTGGGTAMFALLALAGDLGCAGGPTAVGMVSEAAGANIKAGLLAAIVFPIMLIAGLFICGRLNKSK